MPFSPLEIWRFKQTISTAISYSTNLNVPERNLTIDSLFEREAIYVVKGEFRSVEKCGQDYTVKTYEATLTKDGKIGSLFIQGKRVIAT